MILVKSIWSKIMLEYEVLKDIFDEKIFAKSKPDLFKKVTEYPDRYVGLFRSTKPEAKLLQNLLQSNEIRFGDAFEVAIKHYFINESWQPLPQKITSTTHLISTSYLSKITRCYSLSKRYATTIIQPKNVGRLATLKRSLRHLLIFMATR